MISVLVVDDHPVVREGLVSVLGDAPDFDVVGGAESAEAALVDVDRTRPSVVLLDLELPGLDGVAAIAAIAERSPSTRVIVFTAYDTDDRVLGALRAGARGYILKGAPLDEIARAIRTVDAGGSHLDPRIATRVLAQGQSPGGTSRPLTAREREVLELVAMGRSNKQIARVLGITERTVKYHVTALLTKLEADNRAQAVARANQRGLLPAR